MGANSFLLEQILFRREQHILIVASPEILTITLNDGFCVKVISDLVTVGLADNIELRGRRNIQLSNEL